MYAVPLFAKCVPLFDAMILCGCYAAECGRTDALLQMCWVVHEKGKIKHKQLYTEWNVPRLK